MEQKSIFAELLITWRWSSVAFGNIMAVILFLTWWQGESWVRADNGSIIEMSQAMARAQRGK